MCGGGGGGGGDLNVINCMEQSHKTAAMSVNYSAEKGAEAEGKSTAAQSKTTRSRKP